MKECLERLKLAEGQDPSIMTTLEAIHEHKGNDPEYLSSLGLEKNHLKRLQRLGRAFQAYTKNIWLSGETLPSGHVCEIGSSYRGKGMRLKWLLIKKN